MSHMTCGGCRTTLMYPVGSSRCGTARRDRRWYLTRHRRLETFFYRVQCSVCRFINNADSQGYIRCSGCRQTLAFPLGHGAVRCSTCLAVTPVTPGNVLPSPAVVQQQRAAAAAAAAATAGAVVSEQVVLIQGPSYRDDMGNLQENLALGAVRDPSKASVY